jgi:hypothetical protein
MSFYSKSLDDPLLNEFEKLAHLAFNCKWEGDDIITISPEPIKRENLTLLLAWPGLLMMKLIQITGDKTYSGSLNELSKLLNDGYNINEIKHFLDNTITPLRVSDKATAKLKKSIRDNDKSAIEEIRKELFDYTPNIFSKFFLLVHPRNLNLVSGSEILFLIYSLTEFFVLWCMLYRCFSKNDEDTYITKVEMDEIYNRCADFNRLNIYNFAITFPAILDSYIRAMVKSSQEPEEKSENSKTILVSKIITPSIKFTLNRVLPYNHEAFITSYNSTLPIENTKDKVIGIAYNIRAVLGHQNDLWKTYSFKNQKANGYLLLKRIKKSNFLMQLMR